MMLVMVSLSVALVLTYAILQTQSVTSQVSQNALRTDLASQAAQTGAAIALERMQSPDWKGVGEPLRQIIYSDGDGTASFTVEFQKFSPAKEATQVELSPASTSPNSEKITGTDGATDVGGSATYATQVSGLQDIPGVPAWIVRVSSLGTWQSTRDANQMAARSVEVVVSLEPRLPGRGLVSEDHAAAEDLAANPGDFDRIQSHALVARGQNGNVSLNLDPCARIDGSVWVEQRIRMFSDPTWKKPIREQVLRELQSKYIAHDGDRLVVRHPHPLGGPVLFHSSPDGTTKSDLDCVGIPWTRRETKCDWPASDFSKWYRYQLYRGGFDYEAATLPSSLGSVTLRPTPDNPLGVFQARGTLTLRNDVTIQGTLVCDGTVNIVGNRVRICSHNWHDADGRDQVPDARLMPRLPAIVAQNVVFGRETTALVEGAVVVTKSVTGAGGNYEWSSGPYGSISQFDLMGKATARPLGQPFSEVRLAEAKSLASVVGGEEFSIWLADGDSGSWYPIRNINNSSGAMTIVGEARFDSPTPYRIRRTRKRSVDIRGPVAGEWFNFHRPDDWGNLTESQWDKLHAAWQSTGELVNGDKVSSSPTTPFLDYLSNPTNFLLGGCPESYARFGLTLEPTFHIRPVRDVHHRWSPPLFEPYTGTADNGKHAGYRWKVLSWREIEPKVDAVKTDALDPVWLTQ